MAVFLPLVALLLAFAGGCGAVLLLAPSKAKDSLAELAGTALLLGAGIVSLLSVILGVFLNGAILRCTIAAVCLGLPALAWRRRRDLFLEARPRLDLAGMIVVVLAVAQICLVTWVALYRSTLGWDGLFNWEGKARIAFLNGGAMPLSFYAGGAGFFHTAYPLLLPLFQTWMYGWLGHIDQTLVKLVGPYFYCAALLLLAGAARRAGTSRWAGIVALILFGCVPAFLIGEGSATSGYADFPFSVIWLCAVVHSAGYWRTGSLTDARLAGASALLLPFMKSEGIIGLLCIFIGVAPRLFETRNWRAGAWMFAPGLMVWMGWAAFLRLNSISEGDFVPLRPAFLLAHLNRAPDLLRWTFGELTRWNRWSLLWPLAAAALCHWIWKSNRTAPWFPWAISLILPLILYPCVFFFSAWNPIGPHVLSSLGRLFMHNGLVAIVVSSAGIGGMLGAIHRQKLSAPEILSETLHIEPRAPRRRSRKTR